MAKEKNYEEFVEKFKPKLTTDDCYTPDEVYSIVLNYVKKNSNIKGLKIIRPFYPNADYKKVNYTNKSIVIDNPPFSIISEIARFYIANNIKFFLFAPHMTLFSADLDCTCIVAGCNIIYENGAVVKTSFLSNLFGDIKILTANDLYLSVQEYNKKKKVSFPKYEYPKHVLTVSMVQKFVENNIPLKIKKESCSFVRALDCQREHKKGIFGSGFLLSEKAAAEKAAAEKAAAEKAAAEKAAAEKAAAKKLADKKDEKYSWKLSTNEKNKIKKLK